MSNPSKAKGTACETAIVRWLRDNGFGGADRQPLRGGHDQGDIAACPGVIIEAKTSARTKATGLPADSVLTEWLDQTELERVNAGAAIGLLVVKRHGTTNPGRWHCWMRAYDLCDNVRIEAADLPIMLSLTHAATALRAQGFGDPLDTAPIETSPVGAPIGGEAS